jgi:hypothetical protein
LANELTAARKAELLTPIYPDSSHLLVACAPGDYSASAIARAVEDCDAQLLGLSLTDMRTDNGRLIVSLTVGARTTEGVTRSLERYGYDVVFARGSNDNLAYNEAIDRVNELIHYLEL